MSSEDDAAVPMLKAVAEREELFNLRFFEYPNSKLFSSLQLCSSKQIEFRFEPDPSLCPVIATLFKASQSEFLFVKFIL